MGQRSKGRNYECRVVETKYTRTREDGSVVTRTSTKHNVPLSELPEYARREMYLMKPTQPTGNLRNSPNSFSKTKGKIRSKWVRPKPKRVWTQRAVEMIKSGLMNTMINPLTRKINANFVKTLLVWPPLKFSRV